MSDFVAVGVDSGASRTRVLASESNFFSFATPSNYSDYLNVLCRFLDGLQKIDRMVIALPTVVEHYVILAPPNLGPGWNESNITKDIRQVSTAQIGEIAVVQDTEAAAHGVLDLHIVRAFPALLVTLSTGIGGALISPNSVRPLEVGHMILDLTGRQSLCGCGQIGCAEADLSGLAIAKQLGTAPENASAEYWQHYGQMLGRFLCILAPLFSAKEVFFIGGVANQANLFLPACSAWIQSQIRRMSPPALSVVDDSDRIGARGARALAHTALFPPQN